MRRSPFDARHISRHFEPLPELTDRENDVLKQLAKRPWASEAKWSFLARVSDSEVWLVNTCTHYVHGFPTSYWVLQHEQRTLWFRTNQGINYRRYPQED